MLRIPPTIRFNYYEPRDPRGNIAKRQSDPKVPFSAIVVDRIHLRIEALWPIAGKSSGSFISLNSGKSLALMDYNCRYRSYFKNIDAPYITQNDESYIAINPAGLPVPHDKYEFYLSKPNFLFFNSPLIGEITSQKLLAHMYPDQDIFEFSTRLAITKNSYSRVRFDSAQVPVSQILKLFESLEKQIRSWIIYPDRLALFHDDPGACVNEER